MGIREQPASGSLAARLAGLFDPEPDIAAPEPVAEGYDPPVEHNDLAARLVQAVERYWGSVVHRTDDPLVGLAQYSGHGGLTVVVHADDEHDHDTVTAVLRRYPLLQREAGTDPASGVRLLVAGTCDAVPGVDDLDPLTTPVHWWWGVLGRIDLLTAASAGVGPPGATQRRLLDDLCPDLVPEVIAEVAAPDVELAARLGHEWDGTTAHLYELVRVLVPASECALGQDGRPATGRPVLSARGAWRIGHLDVWRGVHRVPSRVSDGADRVLAERTWIGQARAVNPVLDDLRRAFVRLVEAEAGAAALTDLARRHGLRDGVHGIELNDLRKAVHAGVVPLSARMRPHLDRVVGARNKLAHRQPLDDQRIRELAAVVADLPAPSSTS